MKIKSGAVLAGLSIKMRPALIAMDRIWKNHGQELVITAGLDGTHSAGSLHYYGLAVDARTRYFDKQTQMKIKKELDDELGLNYDVVIEASHLHLEFDKKD